MKNNEKYKFVTYGSDDIKSIKDAFNVSEKQICRIPFFTSIKAEKKEIKSNICFIGSLFGCNDFNNPVNKFTKYNPSDDEITIFYKTLELCKNNPFITENQILSFLGIVSDNILNILNIPNLINYISSVNRVKTLSAVADFGLDLYGPSDWLDLNFYPEITLSYRQQPVWSVQHNQDIYNSSKIGISIAHAQATSAFPWRITDIMASNACLVSDYHSDFDLYFPNVKIPTFSSPAEAHDVCKDLLENENKRLDIVAACQKAIDERFRFENVLKTLEDFSGIILHSASQGTVKRIPCVIKASHNIKFGKLFKYSFKLLLSQKLFLSSEKKEMYKIKIKELLK